MKVAEKNILTHILMTLDLCSIFVLLVSWILFFFFKWKEIFIRKLWGWLGQAESSLTGERKAEVSGPQRTEPVWSGQGKDEGAQDTVLQPQPGSSTAVNDTKHFLSLGRIKKWFKFRRRNSHYPAWVLCPPLSNWFRYNHQMVAGHIKKKK